MNVAKTNEIIIVESIRYVENHEQISTSEEDVEIIFGHSSNTRSVMSAVKKHHHQMLYLLMQMKMYV